MSRKFFREASRHDLRLAGADAREALRAKKQSISGFSDAIENRKRERAAESEGLCRSEGQFPPSYVHDEHGKSRYLQREILIS